MNRTSFASLLVVLGLILVGAPVSGQAQTCDGIAPDKFPCGYAIADLAVQRVPALFKLQARVAQAKLPVGEGTFATVVVKLVRGSEVLCLESFGNVQVKESVLNLEIGRNMSCELDEYIAKNEDLAFQVCLGGADNCLKPVALAATPYAVKSTYAVHATDAMKATSAAQASYAYRVTADRDLIATRQLGTGYFDFYSPGADANSPACNASWLPGNPVCDPDAGYVQWTPVRDANALDLTVAGKAAGTDRMVELSSLVLASEATTATGDLTVTPSAGGQGLTVSARGAHVVGDSDVTGELTISDRTTVMADGIHVTGASDVFGTLQVSEATTVAAGGIHVTGASDIDGDTTISGSLAVAASANGTGAGLTYDTDSGLMVVTGGAHVNGDSNVSGAFDVNGGFSVYADPSQADPALSIDAAGFDVNGLDVTIDGQVSIGGKLSVGGDVAIPNGSILLGTTNTLASDVGAGKMIVSGPVTFTSPVVFQGGSSETNSAYVLREGESRPVTMGSTLGVTGLLSALGGLTATGGFSVVSASPVAVGLSYTTAAGLKVLLGGLHVTGTSDFGGTLMVTAGGMTVAGASVFNGLLTAAAGLAVTGASNLAGKLSVTTGGLAVTGASAFTDRLTVTANGVDVTGPSTFRNAVTVTGGGVAVTGASSVAGKLTVSSGGMAVTGTSSFSDKLTVAANGVDVTGVGTFRSGLSVPANGVDVTGVGTFRSGVTVAANGVDVTGASTLRGALTVTSGGVAVTGASSVAGKLTVSSGGAAVTGTSSFSDKLTVSANGVDVTGASTFRTGVSVTSGGLSVAAGGLTVTGTATATDMTVSGTIDLGYAVVTCASTNTCACPTGKKALGGGVACESNNHHVHTSNPSTDGSGWNGICENNVGTNQTPGNVYAICARVR